MITAYLIDAIWLEAEPHASAAFERIAADHGRGFAEGLRDQILGAKLVDWNEQQIFSGRADKAARN